MWVDTGFKRGFRNCSKKNASFKTRFEHFTFKYTRHRLCTNYNHNTCMKIFKYLIRYIFLWSIFIKMKRIPWNVLNKRFGTGGKFFLNTIWRRESCQTCPFSIYTIPLVSSLPALPAFSIPFWPGRLDHSVFSPRSGLTYRDFCWRVDGSPGALALTWRVSVAGRGSGGTRRRSLQGDRQLPQSLPLPRSR